MYLVFIDFNACICCTRIYIYTSTIVCTIIRTEICVWLFASLRFFDSITQFDSLPIRQMLAYSQGRPWDIPQNDETCTILIMSINLFNLLVGLLTYIWFTVSVTCLCVAFLRYLWVNVYMFAYIYIYICYTIFLWFYCFGQVDISICLGAMWIKLQHWPPKRRFHRAIRQHRRDQEFSRICTTGWHRTWTLNRAWLGFPIFFCVPEFGKAGIFLGGVFEGGCRVHLEAVEINVYIYAMCHSVSLCPHHPPALNIHRQR